MKDAEELNKWISSIKEDIRAEVLVDDILTNFNSDDEQLLINFDGQFSRTYRHDILSSNVVDFELDAKQILKITLSRDNVYNTLPQGITHVAKHDELGQSVEKIVKSYRDTKIQSENAKKFFSPFQNEIFFAGVSLENIEKKLFFGLDGNKPLDFQYDFWGIPKHLPELLVAKFVRLLPYKYKFTGNLQLIMECLSYILDEKVSFSESGYKSYNDENQGINLGEARLGIDLISGSSFTDYSLHIKVSIGPLENYQLSQFMHQEPVQQFLDLFYETFLPIEIETTTLLLLSEEKQSFHFENHNKPVLGYTTRL